MTLAKFLLIWMVLALIAAAGWAWFRRRERRKRWTDWYIGTAPLPDEDGLPNKRRGRVWDEQERALHRDRRERKKLRIVQ
jgi:hypothetical protein